LTDLCHLILFCWAWIEKTEEEKRMEEERQIEEAQARHKALVSVQEAATGTQYTEPMKTR
jgi:ATP-dependent RNA helicase DDX41